MRDNASSTRIRTLRRSTRRSCAIRSAMEPLESRQLLSTINWTNRNITSDSDPNDNRFDNVFGSLANQAILVIDAAIQSWQRTIASFNYGNGTETYSLTVKMNAADANGTSSTGGSANGGFSASINNKPSVGSIALGWTSGIAPGTNTAAGWFLDPTPNDSSEFQGGWHNAFARNPTSNLGGADLFSVTLHELGHCVGLASTSQTRAVSFDTNSTDGVFSPPSNPPSTLWAFNGNGSLWTEWDSGGAAGGGPSNHGGPQHFAPLGTSAVVNGTTRVGAVALMNFTNRAIISDLEADCARLAYGYSINKPSEVGTTYGQLDADGTLRIDTTSLFISSFDSDDTIVVNSGNGFVTVDITPTRRVATIDPLGTISSYFIASQVQRITINTGGGNDIIRLESNAGKPCTVNGGTGNDFIDFGFANGNLSNLSGNTVVSGGDGTDTVHTYDRSVSSAQTFTITNLRFDRPGWGGYGYSYDTENHELTTGTGADTVNIQSTALGRPVVVASAGGTDTVNVGNANNGLLSLNADVQVQNDPSFTTLNINDGPNIFTPRNWSVDGFGNFGYIAGIATGTIFWDNSDIQAINLTCGSTVDTGQFVISTETFNVNNTGGNDVIRIGVPAANGLQLISGQITIDNAPAYTTLTIDDTGSSIARTVTIDEVAGYNTVSGMAPGLIRFDSVYTDSTTLIAGSAVDTINILRNDDTLIISNTGGGDVVNLGNTTNGVQSITGSVAISNPPSYTTVNINDTGNNTARTATIDTAADPAFGQLSGLAGAPISWKLADTQAINITTGGAADSLTIYRNSKPMSLNSAGGVDAVQIGHASVGGLQFITGSITVNNTPSHTDLIVTDAGSGVAKNATMDVFGSPPYGRISNLASVPIVWNNNDINTVTVITGNANDTVAVFANTEDLRFNSAGGNDSLFFGSATGLSAISGAVTVDNTAAGTTNVVVDDLGTTTNKTAVTVAHPVGAYTVVTGFAPATMRFGDTHISRVTLRSGNVTGIQPDKFDVTGTAIPLTFSNYGGPDAVNLGGGTFGADGVQAPVNIIGAANTTSVGFLDTGMNITRDMRLGDDGVTATVTGFGPFNHTMAVSTITSTTFMPGNAYDNLQVLGARKTVRFGNNAAGTPTDTLSIGSFTTGLADIHANIEQTISLSPVALALIDTVGTVGRTYNFQPQFFGSILTGNRITFDGNFYLEHFMDTRTQTVSIYSGSGNDSFNVPFARQTGFYLHGLGGNDTFNLATDPTQPSDFINVLGDGGLDYLYVNNEGGSTGAAILDSRMHFNYISVGVGGDVVVLPGGNNLLYTRGVVLGSDSTLNLCDNDLVLDYDEGAPLEFVQDMINEGRGDGSWNGSRGITSSTAAATGNTTLGAMNASDYQSIYGSEALFSGEPIDGTAVLVKYTYYGDTDFNGVVDFDDYVRMDMGYNNGLTGWLNGDSDGNGSIDFDDYVLIDSAYNTQNGTL